MPLSVASLKFASKSYIFYLSFYEFAHVPVYVALAGR
jgi:hypothetical protein